VNTPTDRRRDHTGDGLGRTRSDERRAAAVTDRYDAVRTKGGDNMALTVRFRPNAASLSFLLLGAALIVIGAMSGGVLGLALVVWGAFFAVLLGYPVAASTLLRVPAVVVGPDGIGCR
jgi:hypothetical protein